MNVIEVTDLSKIYNLYQKPMDRLKESVHPLLKKYHTQFYALNNISMTIKKGETVGIIGKNGSGKSTLLKIITGVLNHTGGKVSVVGRVSPLLELGAGFNPEYTGLQNVYHKGLIMGFTKEEMESKIHDIIQFADIPENFLHQPVKTYSSGMFARLAFATAINVEPDILIVDEILSVGDVKFQRKCLNRFKELKEKGVTILFVTHGVGTVREFCDRAIWIHEGSLKMEGDTVQVTSEYMKFMHTPEFTTPTTVSSVEGELSETLVIKESTFKPINRWGSHKNLIQYVEIFNQLEEPTTLLETGEKTKIKTSFFIPSEIDPSTLSVAFSIKNKNGTDLVVSTFFDKEEVRIDKNNCYAEATFEFDNYLTTDDYILVIALEDRSEESPTYYDYLEGASYFKVVSDRTLFGMFNQPTKHSIVYSEGV